MIAATTNDLFREGKEEPTRKLSEMPLIGSSFQRKYGGEDADVVYKLATDAMEAKRTFDSYRKTGKIEDAKDYLREHRAEIAVDDLDLATHVIANAMHSLTHDGIAPRPASLDDETLVREVMRLTMGYLTRRSPH
jgi:hypothetical protein